MSTQLVELEDGILVEIDVSSEQAQPISGGFTRKVNATFEKIKPILLSVCNSLSDTWSEINKDMSIESAEVELGLCFEGEGNIYITKSKAGANLTVKLILKPKE